MTKQEKDKKVVSNLGLVKSIAKKYVQTGIEFDDLVSEGSIGLMRAVDSFDETKGYQFSTYATKIITSEILRYISDNQSMISTSMNSIYDIKKINGFVKDYKQTHNKSPSIKEISKKYNWSESRVKGLLRLKNQIQSIDTIGYTQEPSYNDIESDINLHMLIKGREMLKSLTNKEFLIIKGFFGIGNKQPHTIESAAKRFNLSTGVIKRLIHRVSHI